MTEPAAPTIDARAVAGGTLGALAILAAMPESRARRRLTPAANALANALQLRRHMRAAHWGLAELRAAAATLGQADDVMAFVERVATWLADAPASVGRSVGREAARLERAINEQIARVEAIPGELSATVNDHMRRALNLLAAAVNIVRAGARAAADAAESLLAPIGWGTLALGALAVWLLFK